VGQRLDRVVLEKVVFKDACEQLGRVLAVKVKVAHEPLLAVPHVELFHILEGIEPHLQSMLLGVQLVHDGLQALDLVLELLERLGARGRWILEPLVALDTHRQLVCVLGR
jgi:hypothetical protein